LRDNENKQRRADEDRDPPIRQAAVDPDKALSRPLNEACKQRASDEAGAGGWREPL
jgi:hypothetical protein